MIGRNGGSNGNGQAKLLIEADMDAAEKRSYRRHLAVIDPGPLPFEELTVMPFEEAAEKMVANLGEEPIGHYELMFMHRGFRLFADRLFEGGAGADPLKVARRAYDEARQCFHPAVCKMSMTEQARLFGESKANLSFRIKQLSKKLKRLKQKGFRLPGQKTPDATPKYSNAQKGNSNRRRGRARQMSFLRAFSEQKAKQKTFTKKLNLETRNPREKKAEN